MTKNTHAPEPVQPFGEVENKSLESDDLEVKDAPATVTRPVKMLHHSNYAGRDLLPGCTYDLPRAVAQTLVVNKRAVKL